jgi:hypothetical protein
MTGVLKTLLFLIALYYAWKLLFRLLFPVLLRTAAQKAQSSMNERMKQAYEQQQRNKQGGAAFQDGEVVVQRGAAKSPAVAEDDGEYVEFEEVKN